jgi:alpha-amylase
VPTSALIRRALLSIAWAVAPTGLAAQSARSASSDAWRDGATCYEIFVRSFKDSDGDGIGDLKGLIGALDYINDGNPSSTTSLGARCIWLMPIMESPSYHGYDVSDYYRVAKAYGTNDDFKQLVAESHKRGIRVLVDMVLNHASSQWPPFQEALKNPASPYRDWFLFSPTRGPNNRWGNNNWHKSPLRDEFYYGFFWQGMPDLNYERPAALAEMKKVATFWLTEMGVDGFRLDAVKYLVENGNVVEDTPGTHAVLREYAGYVRQQKPGAFTIGEVFDSTGALLAYYPDQLDAYFAFEIADSLIAGVRRGDGRGILSPVLRLQAALPTHRWGTFLRNHDQPRTRTEFNGSWEQARIAAFLQLTLPGIPFVYYGEELGMTGGKPDNFIRTPMAWTRTGPHAGFTTGTPWEPLASDSLDANVEARTNGPLLQEYRQLIHLRAATPALAHGMLVPVETGSTAIVAFERRGAGETVLVLANIGVDSVRDVSLTLSASAVPPGRLSQATLFGATSEWVVGRDAVPGAPVRVRVARVAPYSGVVLAISAR